MEEAKTIFLLLFKILKNNGQLKLNENYKYLIKYKFIKYY